MLKRISRHIHFFLLYGAILALSIACTSLKPFSPKKLSASSLNGNQFRFLPATTVNQEIAPNTSASLAYTDRYQMYGVAHPGIGTNSSGGICTNLGAANAACVPGHVSSVQIGTLFAKPTKVFVYTQSWFDTISSNISGGTLVDNAIANSHIDIGYNSAANVANQIADMKRRGFSGAIVNWYNASTISGQATAAFRDAAEKMLDSNGNPTFWFATGPDKGAFNCLPDCTANAIAIVQTIYANYITGFKSYIRDSNGNPILYWFIDSGTSPSLTSINWQTVKASLASQGMTPVFIFDKGPAIATGAPLPGTDGAYAWVADGGVSDFTSFFNSALTAFQNNSKVVVGGGIGAGFDDSHAAWGKGRVFARNCGQSWMDSITAMQNNINALPYNAGIGVATWDDYEEGTEIETGIDNCVSGVSLNLVGNNLVWKVNFTDPVNGSERTINNYSVYISKDGQNLMHLTSYGSSTHTVDLRTLGIPAGTWKILVKAVGQPSVVDHISPPVSWTSTGAVF